MPAEKPTEKPTAAEKKQAARRKSVDGKTREITSLKLGKKMQPASDKRQPKALSRLSLSAAKAPKKAVEVVAGKGKKLSDLSYVMDQFERRTRDDVALQTLHRLAYGAPVRGALLKKQLREFSGVVYAEGALSRDKLKARIGARTLNVLRDLCSLVGLERGGDRDEVEERLLAWLEKPADTGAKAAAAPSHKRAAAKASAASPEPRKKKAKAGKKDKAKPAAAKKGSSSSSKKGAATSSKKSGSSSKKGAKGEPKRPLTAYMYFVQENREEMAKKHPKEKVTEIAKRLGESWRKLKEKEKAPFEERAKKDKARYEKEKAKAN
eukprot:m51a1_g4752 putative nhp6ap (322) ;mRNA; f:411485-412748